VCEAPTSTSEDFPANAQQSVERTGIEPVTSGLQIPGFSVELGQIRSIKTKLRRLRAIGIGYSGTRLGTRFWMSASHRRPVWRAGRSSLNLIIESSASTT
jgi:hypothetical protein